MPPSSPLSTVCGFIGSIQTSCTSPCAPAKPPTVAKLLPPSSLKISAQSVLKTRSGFFGSKTSPAKKNGRQTIQLLLSRFSQVTPPSSETNNALAGDSTKQ